MNRRHYWWPLLLFANVLAWSMLGFHRDTGAAPGDVRAPFDNAVQQRNDMLRELRGIAALLKEQNALLRANARQPHVTEPKTRS